MLRSVFEYCITEELPLNVASAVPVNNTKYQPSNFHLGRKLYVIKTNYLKYISFATKLV